MNLRAFVILTVVTLLALAFTAQLSAARTRGSSRSKSDPISGIWDGTFRIAGASAPVTLELKLRGKKVTGTASSAHTGPGTVTNGTWSNNKLSCTLVFAKHESIVVTGSLKDGKLSGEFRTEGMVGSWDAARRASSAATKNSAIVSSGASISSADPISGEWRGTLQAQGSSAPVTLRLKLDGDKVTGTSDSEHLGAGTLSKGTWMNKRLTFTLDVNNGAITFTGELKDGKLAGDFEATNGMRGTWEARKK